MSTLYRGPLQTDVQQVVCGPDILGKYELRVRIQFLNQSSYLLRIQSYWKTKCDYNTKKRLKKTDLKLPYPGSQLRKSILRGPLQWGNPLPLSSSKMLSPSLPLQATPKAASPPSFRSRPGPSPPPGLRGPAELPERTPARRRRGRAAPHPRCSWRPRCPAKER